MLLDPEMIQHSSGHNEKTKLYTEAKKRRRGERLHPVAIYSMLKLQNTVIFMSTDSGCKLGNSTALFNAQSPHPNKFEGADNKLLLHMLQHMAEFQNHSI